MKRDEYLKAVRKHIHFIFDRDAINEELNDHICDSIADLMADGLSRVEAEQCAVEQMGNPDELGKMLNAEHHPLLGYSLVVTNIIVLLLGIPAITMMLSFGHGLIKTVTPTVVENSVETIRIDYEVETPTHRIIIDNLCINEKEQYYLTYRAWTNMGYSRAGWNSVGIQVVDKDGYSSGGSSFSSSSFLRSFGYTRFDMPEDGIVTVSFRDGQTIELDLGVYRK